MTRTFVVEKLAAKLLKRGGSATVTGTMESERGPSCPVQRGQALLVTRAMRGSLVLIPTYNERRNLPRVVAGLSALEEELDVLVIDDASPDGTGEIAEDLRTICPRVSVLHRRVKEGLGPAYLHGFREAFRRGYRRIVTMDADLSHAPEDVPRLLEALEKADVAIGSRHAPGGRVDGWPLARSVLSRAGSLYARMLLRLPVSDVTSGFRAYRTDTLRGVDFDRIAARGFVFQVEVLRRILDLSGTRAQEVPIAFRNRRHGRSKLTFAIIGEAAAEVARLAFRRRTVHQHRPESSRPTGRFEPRVTVVIPALPHNGQPEALKHLGTLDYPEHKLEVLVARGRSPSRQRNEAVSAASGEYLLFLDEDSRVSPRLLREYLAVFEREPAAGAVGGPVESEPGSGFQDLASLVLGEPWVVGRTASRYRARGVSRFTDERELILCNLCVRREAFEAVEGFNEGLYPNEENEFLERLRLSGWRLVYRPEARVARPQRSGLGDLLGSTHRYGRGRAAQMLCLPSRTSILRAGTTFLAVAGLVAGSLAPFAGSPVLAAPLFLHGLYLMAVALRLSRKGDLKRGLLGALLSALVQASYAAGLIQGLLFRNRRPQAGEVTLEPVRLMTERTRVLLLRGGGDRDG